MLSDYLPNKQTNIRTNAQKAERVFCLLDRGKATINNGCAASRNVPSAHQFSMFPVREGTEAAKINGILGGSRKTRGQNKP